MHVSGSSCCLSALLAGALALSSSVASANSCRSLEQSACESQAACSWVDPYQRSDGRAVKGHCRVLPQRNKPGDVTSDSRPAKAAANS